MSDTTLAAPSTPTHSDVRAIEQALNQLWQQSSTGEQGDKRQAIIRTRVLTLIVATRGDEQAARATDTAARLMLRHPHRAIVVNAMPHAAADQLDAWVQAHYAPPSHGHARMCGEQITIVASGAALARVPNTILPLLVPDVPVMLWWMAGAPFDDPRYGKFGDLIDRVVVDSSTFPAPEAGLAAMAAQLAAGARISDLQWSRLTPWRELVAQFFDAPAQVAQLAEISSVTVSYEALAGAADDRSQALLLVGWLAARLGWAPATPARRRGSVTNIQMRRADGSAVRIKLRPARPKDDELDRLASIVLECPRARYTVARDRAPNCAIARAEPAGMPPLQRHVRLEHLDEAELIGAELRLLGQDQTFAETTRIAAQLIG